MAAGEGVGNAGGNVVRLSPNFCFASVAFASAVALSACGGVNAPSTTPVPLQASAAGRAAGGSSWMLPEAKSEDLLYVSDSWATGKV